MPYIARNTWGWTAACSARRALPLQVLLPCVAKLMKLQHHSRQFSSTVASFQTPEIHFGTEDAASPSSRCFTLRTSLHLPAPLHLVWDNFHCPRTLNAITPPHLNFTVTTPQPVHMGEGTIIDYRQTSQSLISIPNPPPKPPTPSSCSLRLHGVPFKWRTR